ncbi:Gfo/Idh/MocA family oxidoreductase [Halogeometricum sp. S1BR25-6]|uniref:Gfo/Idh/MocA family oxidoreductase n=1 Tax=Halogeometricum salsisoli TaxID=2950536 RepID=A0ABU2GJZ0_9EURY|nr:Gfo/Idh/MocA family oxidoreductase [Halogeometricum sp. S1BR25-6]MDS0300598.1 Gfo/Idh/MocA family oxidoreductase [Halogeometricum sp. S1BR25-6]
MTDAPIRFGIVGCASMGATHADAIEAVEGAELRACADHTPATARAFGSARNCAAYGGHAEMFADASLDAVCVCTPNGAHREVVVDAAAAGLDVFCEKPLEVTPERVAEMEAACREAGVTLACVLQRRLLPSMQFAREAVRDGRLGRLVSADARMKWHRDPSYYGESSWHGSETLDGGVLFTQALHGIDLLQWVAGGVERVAGATETRSHDIEVPDTAALSVRFADGAVGTVSATTATRPQQPISLEFNGTEGTLRVTESGVDAFETAVGRTEVDLPDPPADGLHATQMRDFVDAVTEGRPPMVTAKDAREALSVVFAAERSERRGEWVPTSAFEG